ISITLSPAALVCTMRTVAAWTAAEAATTARARARGSLVFIATHFKLPGHVADPLFGLLRAGGVGARLRRVQGQGPAAARRETAGPCPLHPLPLDRDGLPAAAAPQGADRVHRRRNAEELRGRLALRPARR